MPLWSALPTARCRARSPGPWRGTSEPARCCRRVSIGFSRRTSSATRRPSSSGRHSARALPRGSCPKAWARRTPCSRARPRSRGSSTPAAGSSGALWAMGTASAARCWRSASSRRRSWPPCPSAPPPCRTPRGSAASCSAWAATSRSSPPPRRRTSGRGTWRQTMDCSSSHRAAPCCWPRRSRGPCSRRPPQPQRSVGWLPPSSASEGRPRG
mmetsp:Transcript_25106/g.78153  ORF Transcript_25106/g.78153 Transcript_25106/m.78153 type:complete len:212 (-) Transcript_25106:121-756(-)